MLASRLAGLQASLSATLQQDRATTRQVTRVAEFAEVCISNLIVLCVLGGSAVNKLFDFT